MTLSLRSLTIRYGDHTAVDGVTTTFPTGNCGLLGPNGAGKSSILKALLGLVRPSEGTLAVDDVPITDPREVRRAVGYMPERDGYVPGLTGFETVRLCAELSLIPTREAIRRAHEVLYLVGLDEQRYRQVAEYSAGMRQKVKLAAALVHDPRVLLLDEPTNGLDPEGREEMLELIRSLGAELHKSIVLCSHLLRDVEAVCSHVVVIDKGRVVDQGPIERLTTPRELVFEIELIDDEDGRAQASIQQMPVVHGIEKMRDGRLAVRTDADVPAQTLFRAARDAGVGLRQIRQRRRSLEDLFHEVVGVESPPPVPGAGEGEV